MNSEMKECKKEVKRMYPYLGKLSNSKNYFIVLFDSAYCGTIVNFTKSEYCKNKLGTRNNNWNEENFTPLDPEEKVILSND